MVFFRCADRRRLRAVMVRVGFGAAAVTKTLPPAM
jgi:hypothetical protein